MLTKWKVFSKSMHGPELVIASSDGKKIIAEIIVTDIPIEEAESNALMIVNALNSYGGK